MSLDALWRSRRLEVKDARKNEVCEGAKRVSVARPVPACACCIGRHLLSTHQIIRGISGKENESIRKWVSQEGPKPLLNGRGNEIFFSRKDINSLKKNKLL